MSSRAGKMEKQMVVQQAQQAEQKVKNISIQIDVELIKDGILDKTAYVVVTGVPEDLPPEMEGTVISHAQKIFAEMLNSRMYQEFYNRDKTSKDENPIFYNLSRVDAVQVVGVKKIN